MKQRIVMTVLFLCLIRSTVITAASNEQVSARQQRFDEICQIVETNFYTPTVIETGFTKTKTTFRSRIPSLGSNEEFSALVNEMLSTLKASHTGYYTKDDYEYYQLAAIFHFLPEVKALFNDQDITYPSIGILTQTSDEQVFIASVLSGSIAQKAGLQVGDEILAVDGAIYSPIRALINKIEHDVTFTIRRTPNGSPIHIRVQPRMMNPKQEFLEAQQESITIYERGDKRIGYIHLWSYAGEEYHQAFVEAIAWGQLKTADALIWDLRYGWGGANPDYLNVFNPYVPVITGIERDGTRREYDPQWRKPVIMLINDTVRSGKEILAYGFKKYHLGTVIGETTAGAVLGGRIFILSDGSMLFLAVEDSCVDGDRLEGIGVEPDILVPMDIRYCEGKDLQLEKGIEYLLK